MLSQLPQLLRRRAQFFLRRIQIAALLRSLGLALVSVNGKPVDEVGDRRVRALDRRGIIGEVSGIVAA